MHATQGKSCVFFHNGDYSGETIIRTESDEITIDTQDIFNFVADYIRSEKIGKLESMSSDEIFGLK